MPKRPSEHLEAKKSLPRQRRGSVEQLPTEDVQSMSRESILATLQKKAPTELLEDLDEFVGWGLPYTIMRQKYQGNAELWKLILSQEERHIDFRSKKELEEVPPNEQELIRSLGIASTSRDIKALRKFTHVRHLRLKKGENDSGDPIDNLLIDLCNDLKELTTLDIHGRTLSDKGVHSLATLQNLEVLDISGTNMTEQEIVRLAQRLPKLRFLKAISRHFTIEGYMILRDICPNLTVEWEDNY